MFGHLVILLENGSRNIEGCVYIHELTTAYARPQIFLICTKPSHSNNFFSACACERAWLSNCVHTLSVYMDDNGRTACLPIAIAISTCTCTPSPSIVTILPFPFVLVSSWRWWGAIALRAPCPCATTAGAAVVPLLVVSTTATRVVFIPSTRGRRPRSSTAKIVWVTSAAIVSTVVVPWGDFWRALKDQSQGSTPHNQWM